MKNTFQRSLFLIIPIAIIVCGVAIYLYYQSSEKADSLKTNKTHVSSLLGESLSLEERVQQSATVVRGQIQEELPSGRVKREKQEFVYTDFVLQVNEYLTNPLSYEKLHVRIEGGVLDGEEVFVEDEPTLSVGEEVILFLTRATYLTDESSPDTYSIFWGKDGKYVIEGGKAIGGYSKESLNLGTFISEIKE